MGFSTFEDNKKLFHKILILKEISKDMEMNQFFPIMIYDDNCYYCSKFANIVKFFVGENIMMVGQYSNLGMSIKSKIFPKDYDATRMFWFITNKVAYGGRAGILPLLFFILTRSSKKGVLKKDIPLKYGTNCRTPDAFFVRIKTLLSNSEKIKLNS